MQNFYGVITPIITCFDKNDHAAINVKDQQRLIAYLFEKQQVDGIAACASAGEGVVLSDEEYWTVAEICLEECKRRKKIAILTTSHSNYRVTIARNIRAKALGFDALMLTPPPYIKPDQKAIKAYYQEVAAQSKGMPIIIYNIWYRTGGNPIDAKTIIELAKHENIVGIKDCGVSIEHIDEVIEYTQRENFAYFCGEDMLYFDYLMHGAIGTISAASHIVGKMMREMLQAKQESKIDDCLIKHRKIKHIIRTLFSEPSPTVIMAALSHLNVCDSEPRYPVLLPASNQARKDIQQQLQILNME